jgi:tRNA A-37 threonylcarbamoyl transferase component Bud32
VLATLKSIHRAGILHGDIRRSNIPVADSGLTIIDFGSEKCEDQEAKEKEYSRLQSVLKLVM